MDESNADGLVTHRLAADPRFSCTTYVPLQVTNGISRPATLLVAVHGSDRDHLRLQQLFRAFADRHGIAVLTPLFPVVVDGHSDPHAYKYLRANGIAYDELVLSMVDEASRQASIDARRFLLFGFSGGAQFALRFLYAHPERLAGLVVAAPGSVTLPIRDEEWWLGLGGFEERFGYEPSMAATLRVPTQLLIGTEDLRTHGIDRPSGTTYWHPRAATMGTTRVDRLRRLHGALLAVGAQVTHRELPGVGHEYEPLVLAAQEYFGTLVAPAQAVDDPR